jgi:UDP-3-O-[3-hydroxymyristoyl] glucosamine N-acyltransferase
MTTLGELARLVGGRLQGDAALPICGASALVDAGQGEITLIDGPQRVADLEGSSAAAVVAPSGIAIPTLAAVLVDDPHAAFRTIVQFFRPRQRSTFEGIHPTATIDPSAELAEDVTVHAAATIAENVRIGSGTVVHSGARIGANCVIGRDVTVYPNVVLYEDTRIGDRATVHAGAVIGAHGFGYEQQDGRHVPTAQLGWVEIGDDVEIGASTTIDRGTYGPTVIGQGTKIDNLVQIAHNCRLGRHNLICSQVGIAGSTTTGDYVVMAGQVGIRDHVHIGRGAVLSAMAGITSDVPDGAVMMGIPATREREQKLKLAALAKLPEMRKEFKALKRELGALSHQDTDQAEPHASHRVEGEAA